MRVSDDCSTKRIAEKELKAGVSCKVGIEKAGSQGAHQQQYRNSSA